MAAELVTALRILEANGIVDFNGHASVRFGGGCLINSGKSVRSALTADDIIAVDADGEAPVGSPAPPMEVPLHTQIYRSRPDVEAIVHGHPLWSTILPSAGKPYRPVFPQGALLGEPPVHMSPLSINTTEAGDAVAAALGTMPAILLRSHGMVTVGPNIRTATILALYLEDNARRQCLAEPLGGAYVLSQDEVAACRTNLDKPNLFAKAWDYFEAKLR